MHLFELLNWILLFSTFSFIIIAVVYFKYLLIKPSIIVIIFYHIQIQWAGTLKSDFIYEYLPTPESFFILLHGFPIVGIFFSLFMFRRYSLEIYKRIKTEHFLVDIRSFILLTSFMFIILLFYLTVVPFRSSGIYAILFNSQDSAQSRENSLKLLDNMYLKYAYTFFRSAFAPLLAVIIAHNLTQYLKNKSFIKASYMAGVLLIVFFSVMLPGDRVSAAYIVLAIIFSFFLKKGIPLKPHILIASGIVILLIPVILSILREGKAIDVGIVFRYLGTGIFNRVFIVPMDTGLWHAHYAQMNEYIGIAGIPKLASLYGVDIVNVPSLIYHHYTAAPIPTGLANTSYVFSYYSLFGLPSLIISLIFLWTLDFVIVVYRYLPLHLLLPTVSAIFIASTRFIGSDYTTTLLSGGFILIPLVAISLLYVSKIKFR